MAGGRKRMGYAGRKFTGRRLLNGRTPGLPSKHSAWPGIQLADDVTIENQSVKAPRVEPRVKVYDMTHLASKGA